MITSLSQTNGSLLAFEASLKLTHQDYQERFLPHLEQALHQFGKVNLVLLFDEHFTGWDHGAMWDDIRFGAQHHNDFTRLAVVGELRWQQWGTNIASAISQGEIQSFRLEELEEALRWAGAE